MAVKTFTDNTALPASDINTYLTNSGLVYVKSQTVGSAVSSVTVTGAFSADYDNYKIQWSGATSLSSGNAINMTLGALTTGYYAVMIYASYAAGVQGVVIDTNIANWTHCAGAVGSQSLLDVDIYNPFKTQLTTISALTYTDAANAGKKTGYLNSTTSVTSFTLIAATGTLTGGTITVYGYRKG